MQDKVHKVCSTPNTNAYLLTSLFSFRYGSAAYKASSYAILSSLVYIFMYWYGTTQNPTWNIANGINASPQSNAWNMNNGGQLHTVSNNDNATEDMFQGFELMSHPFPVSIIVTAVMFLLSHKVNFCYNRVSPLVVVANNMHISCSYLICVYSIANTYTVLGSLSSIT